MNRLMLPLAAALAAAGCGPATGTLTGTVTAAGRPVPAALVTVLTGERGEAVLRASADAAGRFRVEGVPVGPARVAVAPKPADLVSGPTPPDRSVPPRYADPRTSGLGLTVVPGEQEFSIELK